MNTFYGLRLPEVLALRKLGLATDPKIELPHGMQVDLGEYIAEGDGGERWRARVFVTAMPARFWRFDITRANGTRARVTTGSGTLEEYWPMAAAVAEDMLEVENPRRDDQLLEHEGTSPPTGIPGGEDFPRPMGVPRLTEQTDLPLLTVEECIAELERRRGGDVRSAIARSHGTHSGALRRRLQGRLEQRRVDEIRGELGKTTREEM